jgi:hypothetical protein
MAHVGDDGQIHFHVDIQQASHLIILRCSCATMSGKPPEIRDATSRSHHACCRSERAKPRKGTARNSLLLTAPRPPPTHARTRVDRSCALAERLILLEEPVAQPVEHVTFNHGVAGSSPAGLAKEIKDLTNKFKSTASQKLPLGSAWEALGSSSQNATFCDLHHRYFGRQLVAFPLEGSAGNWLGPRRWRGLPCVISSMLQSLPRWRACLL